MPLRRCGWHSAFRRTFSISSDAPILSATALPVMIRLPPSRRFGTRGSMTSSKVYVNADVTTLDESRPRARGLVVKNGIIERLLDSRPSGLPRDAEVIDCAGAAIVPGFHDCHVHLTDTGLLAGDHDVHGCGTIDAILARVRSLPDR